MSAAFVYGAFDDLRSADIRFLEEAARLGPLAVLLWPDEAVARIEGRPPKFPLAERRYFLEALRWVEAVLPAEAEADPDAPRAELVEAAARAAESAAGAAVPAWVLRSESGPASERAGPAKAAWCARLGFELRAMGEGQLAGFRYEAPAPETPPPRGAKRVVVTGCYDWVHSGHVRFFEEASEKGELNVVIGSDANVRLLKGEGHPLQGEAERRYVVGSMRRVARCLVSTGTGWMDAEPEIERLRAERYVVNADGDKPEKREYCRRKGLEYIVLERTPKEGLPRRSSTDLRGF